MFLNQCYIRRYKHLKTIIALIGAVVIVSFLNANFYTKQLSCDSASIQTVSPDVAHELINEEDESVALDAYSLWCLHLGHRFDSDRQLHRTPVLRAPPVDSTRLQRLPYYYTYWKSTPLLSRRLTKCEHSILMRLFMVADRICRKNKIEYMISDGTLLGSLRHHDITPWDTDADMMIADEGKDRFLDQVNQMNETIVLHRVLGSRHYKKEYYKIFFRSTPSAGGYSWNFPFIDIYVYLKNETHVWSMGYPEYGQDIKYYYPIVMRPLGELWLPAPRQAQKLFEFDPFDECKTHWWNHRNETGDYVNSQKCADLKDFYPFVEKNNQSNSTTEVLKINNTIIHTVLYD
ncbi:unnamed protein product [Adineta ricciae]|uniref:LicD/FKTN/FKRP nucleotidyltransferase domain-containing protein n=1 Tax=Adineta ricciae TaxID=249248 RepID=A0A815UES0_ADIRI|nr:unnamed protein product [Adineta ricciae]